MAFSTPLPPNLGGKKKEREYLGDTLDTLTLGEGVWQCAGTDAHMSGGDGSLHLGIEVLLPMNYNPITGRAGAGASGQPAVGASLPSLPCEAKEV